MAQHDKEHIGDSQNPQWWGAKQGLFINSLANQFGQFDIDSQWENTINQNTIWNFESWNKGSLLFTNAFYSNLNLDTIQGTGFYWLNGSRTVVGFPQIKDNYILFCNKSIRRTGLIDRLITNPANILLNNVHSFNGTLHYSENPPSFNAFIPYENRIREINKLPFFSPSPFLSTDNLYPIGCKIMRLNYGDANAGGFQNYYINGVVRDLRIYTRVVSDQETSNNYHSFSATNTANLFLEWKMSQLSDFYTFGGLLYARNTGSSGNGLDNGTGYDLNLIGYVGNIPTLQSIY